MAVTLLGEIARGAQEGTRNIERHFLVLLDSGNYGKWGAALAATGLPKKGNQHPTKTTFTASDVCAREHLASHPQIAEVVAVYGPKPGCDMAERATAPWSDDWTWNIRGQRYEVYDGLCYDTVAAEFGVNCNSAGDVFEPPVPRILSRELIVLTKSYEASGFATYPLSLYRGCVNDDAVTILGRSSAAEGYNFLCVDIIISKGFWLDPTTSTLKAYVTCTYEIEYDPRADGYAIKQLSIGFREKNATTGKLTPILAPLLTGQTTRHPITHPYRLQASGAAYSDEQQTDPDNAYYLSPRLFQNTAEFADLNLPEAE